ncbi:nucleotidyltransferase domain-containing protein [Candidatus Woesearchaeota archaeon]|nr:nucleotidyltransferase domain-containing protein [Candidatus Woesearchaeota archaeon]
MNIKTLTKKLLALDTKKAIRFIILFGSTAKGKNTPLSDIDLAVYYQGNKSERFKFRVNASGELPNKVDLHIFQDLPVAVQKEVLGGKPIYYQDYQFMFEQYMAVIKEFNTFEKYYNQYLHELRQGVGA